MKAFKVDVQMRLDGKVASRTETAGDEEPSMLEVLEMMAGGVGAIFGMADAMAEHCGVDPKVLRAKLLTMAHKHIGEREEVECKIITSISG